MESMEQVIEREKSLLDRMITIEPTPRFERLKEVFLRTEPVLEIDRDRIYTRVMQETDGEPMAIRRAKAFCAVVREMPINIAPDELFAGHVNATWAGHRDSAEAGAQMEGVLDYAARRRSIISEADERELREEIIP